MDKPQENKVLDNIEGLTEIDPKKLEDFKKHMTEKVIPEVVEVVEERRLRAAESRLWQLKC